MVKKPAIEFKTKGEITQTQFPDTQAINDFIGSSKDAIATNATAPVVPIPMVAVPRNQTKTFPLLLSAETHQEIAAAARRDGKSIKDFILTAIYEKIERNN